MLGSDVVAPSKEENDEQDRAKSDRKSRVGFNKRLLKNKCGEEQCFEEARALAGAYNLLPDSTSNFNLLFVTKMDQSSQMDLEDDVECSIDMSMVESESRMAEYSTATLQPKKLQRLGSKTDGIRLFHQDVSVDGGLNQTTTSNASSTINVLDAVGVQVPKEEETINTKLAMKELSMMFSSPAFGEDGPRKRHDQSFVSRIDENSAGHSPGGDTSFTNVGDSLGNILLDNSICNMGGEGAHGILNPGTKISENTSFEVTGLRKLNMNSASREPNVIRSIESKSAVVLVQERPFKKREKESHGNLNYLVRKVESPTPGHASAKGFHIFDENDQSDSTVKSTFNQNADEQKSFAIYQESLHEHSTASSDLVENDVSCLAHGDTASFSEALCVFEEGQAADVQTIGQAADDDNTATLSLFNDVFYMKDPSTKQKSHPIDTPIPEVEQSSGGLFMIYVDGDDEGEGNQVS
jgi:hypothetical protein